MPRPVNDTHGFICLSPSPSCRTAKVSNRCGTANASWSTARDVSVVVDRVPSEIPLAKVLSKKSKRDAKTVEAEWSCLELSEPGRRPIVGEVGVVIVKVDRRIEALVWNLRTSGCSRWWGGSRAWLSWDRGDRNGGNGR
jgi:hypothetical protein